MYKTLASLLKMWTFKNQDINSRVPQGIKMWVLYYIKECFIKLIDSLQLDNFYQSLTIDWLFTAAL